MAENLRQKTVAECRQKKIARSADPVKMQFITKPPYNLGGNFVFWYYPTLDVT